LAPALLRFLRDRFNYLLIFNRTSAFAQLVGGVVVGHRDAPLAPPPARGFWLQSRL
jgi:hypothetical protein